MEGRAAPELPITSASFALAAADFALNVAKDNHERLNDMERRLVALEQQRPALPDDVMSPALRAAYTRATADLLPIDKRRVRHEMEKWKAEPVGEDEMIRRLNKGAVAPEEASA